MIKAVIVVSKQHFSSTILRYVFHMYRQIKTLKKCGPLNRARQQGKNTVIAMVTHISLETMRFLAFLAFSISSPSKGTTMLPVSLKSR